MQYAPTSTIALPDGIDQRISQHPIRHSSFVIRCSPPPPCLRVSCAVPLTIHDAHPARARVPRNEATNRGSTAMT